MSKDNILAIAEDLDNSFDTEPYESSEEDKENHFFCKTPAEIEDLRKKINYVIDLGRQFLEEEEFAKMSGEVGTNMDSENTD